MNIAIKQALTSVLLIHSVLTSHNGSRKPRNLVFPDRSFIQFIFGFGIPISIQDQSITMGTTMKFIYDEPPNSTIFTDLYPPVVRRSAASRWDVYSALETRIERLGGNSGRACVLRAICEAADTTLKHNGLFGEVLHLLMSPSTTMERDQRASHREYFAAERLGSQVSGSCHLLYPECNFALLDFISQLIFGFGLPVAFDEYSILMGTVTKFHYDLPTNSTAYTERSTASRWSLYSKLEGLLQRVQLEGKACILRAICEAADGSLRHNGLIGEILHILLTPSTSRDSRGANRDYHGAERLGCKASGHCHVLYKECRLSLLDLISQTKTFM